MNKTLGTLLISYLLSFANCGPELGPLVSYEDTTVIKSPDMSQPSAPDAAMPILQCAKQLDMQVGAYCCTATCLTGGVVRIFVGEYSQNDRGEIYCNTLPAPQDYDCKKRGLICMASDDIGGCMQ
jgi:hypothetical protein